ncbi:transcription repressor KAN1-like isoform X2 [Zingiber officinale]|uniref:transcription repressor KAN1-like isoform X2 n=1 Tax=Zingiber officinale TaxID=94328 RepID=UPI001C4C559D|nr:transcription repressor KAN1-like isoform X2 [Zingiber officinale]
MHLPPTLLSSITEDLMMLSPVVFGEATTPADSPDLSLQIGPPKSSVTSVTDLRPSSFIPTDQAPPPLHPSNRMPSSFPCCCGSTWLLGLRPESPTAGGYGHQLHPFGVTGTNILHPCKLVSSKFMMPRKSRTPRMRWTSILHARFVHAVDLLGGHERATPKSILELMDVTDLTLAHVKSHLQMYRTVKSTDKPAVSSDCSVQEDLEPGNKSSGVQTDTKQKRISTDELGSLSSTLSSQIEDSDNPSRSNDTSSSRCDDRSPSLEFCLGRPDWNFK